MPRWIAARLARAQQRASPETLQFLADTTEGNLLAARQEIEKIGLLLPAGELDADAVEHAVADVARFDVFQLSEAWLAGDAARACRILAALENEGEGVPLLLWQLGEDLHALAAVLAATATGTPVAVAVRTARVWGKRQAAMERAARRVAPASLPALLLRLARLDALAKGIGRGNVWDELRELALALAGRPAGGDVLIGAVRRTPVRRTTAGSSAVPPRGLPSMHRGWLRSRLRSAMISASASTAR